MLSNSQWQEISRKLFLLSILTVSLGFPPLASALEIDKFAQSSKIGDITVESEEQITDTSLGTFTAKGNVKISYPSKSIFATSSKAEYIKNSSMIVLTGDVDLIHQGNQSLQAHRVVYLIKDDHFWVDSISGKQSLLKLLLYRQTDNPETFD